GVVPARAIRACPRRTCAPVATVGWTRRPRTAGSAARLGFAVTRSGGSPAAYTITIGGPARTAPGPGVATRVSARGGPAGPVAGRGPGRPAGLAVRAGT